MMSLARCSSTAVISIITLLSGHGLANSAPTPLYEPLLPKATFTGAVIELEDFATLPKESNGSPARVNFLMPAPDNTTDLLVVDQGGIIYRISADGFKVTIYLDLRAQKLSLVSSASEEGFVGLAFHPNFSGDPTKPGYGKFYTAFSASKTSGTPDFLASDAGDHHQVIREWTASDPYSRAFTGTSREVLRVGRYASNHNGGVIRFNPNPTFGTYDYGNLYIGFGDGGGENDPRNNGQNLTTPLGKILRINPLAGANGAKYTIPSDNPFRKIASAGPLIWANGLRNPQQFSWEIGGQGRMFIDDIGQNQVEEVNLGARGANYGWSLREGTFATGVAVGSPGGKRDYLDYPIPADDAKKGYAYPIAEYDHSDEARDGKTVASGVGSGFIYQGSFAPNYRGFYVFGDFVQGKLFAINANGPLSAAMDLYSLQFLYHGMSYTSLSTSPIGEKTRSDFRIGEDRNGELYGLLKGTGGIYRFILPR